MWRLFYLSWLFIGAGAYLYWDGGDLFRSHDSEGELRRQFHIPAGIEIANVNRTGGRDTCSGGGIVTGQAKFTVQAYRAYLATLDDRSVWRPTPLHHYSDDLSDYRFNQGALEWRRFDPSERRRGPVPFHVHQAKLMGSGPGRMLCYALAVPARDLVGTPEGAGYSGISVVPCDSMAPHETPKSWVLGILDGGSQTLRMRIQLTNPPQYCARARRRPLAERS